MKEFCVRAGAPGDLARVIALERATEEAPHWTEAEYAAVVTGDRSYVRRCLFIAEAEGTLLGFAVGKIVGDIAELESVAVDLGTRRGGVGRQLCGAVVEWSRRQAATTIELEVRGASAGAIGLYQRLGFVVVGCRPGYYSDPPDDAVLMRLDLVGVI